MEQDFIDFKFKPPTREVTVEQYLVRRVKSLGGECRKHTGQRAWLDRIVLFKGGVIGFVEVKRKGEKAKAHQKREMQRLRHLGFQAYVVDSKESVDRMLQTLRREHESHEL